MAAKLSSLGGVTMNNKNEDILKLLNLLNDESLEIKCIQVDGFIKTIHISRKPFATYCNKCGSRMHSKGIYKRSLNHQILQDTTTLEIVLSQRKWKCTNCGYYKNETFSFAKKRNTINHINSILCFTSHERSQSFCSFYC